MKNDYEIRGDVTAIFLNSPKYGRMETLIATSDLDRAKELPGTWYAKYEKKVNSFYVQGNLPQVNGKQKNVKFHRWILNVTDSKKLVDHILHDTLDNCRWALNIVTNTENSQNARKKRNNTSGYTGVKWHKQLGKWEVCIDVEGNRKYLGWFENIDDAIKVRKEAEMSYFEYRKKLF